MLWITLTLIVLLVATIWLYGKHRHSYWAKRGIPGPFATPILGHLHRVLSTKHGRWVFDNEIYCKYMTNGMAGYYSLFTPLLYISDPELIKKVFIKDFDHFTDRRVFHSGVDKDKVMNNMLSNVNGEKWKSLRTLMSPTFTSGKMRSMFSLVCEKADALVTFSLSEATRKPYVNMRYNLGRFTMDTIASCAFGLECNSLVDESAVFPSKADPFFQVSTFRMIKFMIGILAPWFSKLFKISLFPDETMFFKAVAEKTIAARRKGEKRGDFLDLLLEAHESGKDSDKQVMDDETMVAQSILFIIAGYDTTATTISFASYELSMNQDKQELLRQELKHMIQEHGGITYQGIMEAKYLEACVLETLRKYPTAPMLERICSKEYKIPGTELTLNKGNAVHVPVWSIHHDEKYWPEPENFEPARFMPENKDAITPYTHMPFGLGPRNCIAMRFAIMEAKVALAKMVLGMRMKIAPGHEELVLTTGVALLSTKEINLLLEPIKEEFA